MEFLPNPRQAIFLSNNFGALAIFKQLQIFFGIKYHVVTPINENAYFSKLWHFSNHLHFKGLRNFNHWSVLTHVSCMRTWAYTLDFAILIKILLSSCFHVFLKWLSSPAVLISLLSQVVPPLGRWKTLFTSVGAPTSAYTLVEKNLKTEKELSRQADLELVWCISSLGLFSSHVVFIPIG